MLVWSCISFRWIFFWLASLSEMDGLDSWVVLFDADCRINRWLVDNAIGVVSASAVVVLLLMRTCACGDTSMPVFLVVLPAMIVFWLTPIGDVWGVIWLFFSVSGARLHGASRPSSCRLSCIVVGCSTSRILSNWVVGRLISVMRELTLTEQGDLESCLDLRSFGVAAVVVVVLLVGFSLGFEERVVMPMVGDSQSEGLTPMGERRSAMMLIEIISITSLVWSLMCLCHSVFIMRVSTHPRRGVEVVVVCYSSVVLMLI
jgi:hypothetical protein